MQQLGETVLQRSVLYMEYRAFELTLTDELSFQGWTRPIVIAQDFC
jgi:hypothetical protein